MTTDPATAPPVNLAPLYGALARAIGRANAVGKTAENTYHRYKYASAEGLISEARGALAAEGLCVFPREWRLKPHGSDGDGAQAAAGYFADVEVCYIVAHADGGSMQCEAITPVIREKGRPEDKALAAALTYSLGYFLRALLLLPRVDEEDGDVDQRDDRGYEPRCGSDNQRDQRQQADRSKSDGAGKLPTAPPQGKTPTQEAAKPFDASAALLAISRAGSEAALRTIAATFEAAPDGIKPTLREVYAARLAEVRKAAPPTDSPPPAEAAKPDARPPAAAEETAADPGWLAFLADIQKGTGEITEGWTPGYALIAWEAVLKFSPDRKRLDDLAAPWVTAARKRSGPAVSAIRARIDSDYKARRAELPAVAPETTGAAA